LSPLPLVSATPPAFDKLSNLETSFAKTNIRWFLTGGLDLVVREPDTQTPEKCTTYGPFPLGLERVTQIA